MKKTINILLIIAGVLVLILFSLLTWLTLTDYKPAEIEELEINSRSGENLPLEFTIFNWNIGYGALGENADFFFDGGETIITPESDYKEYMEG